MSWVQTQLIEGKAMTTPVRAIAISASLILSGTSPAFAQEQSDIAFSRGQSSAVLNGVIVGRRYRDYLLRVSAGQRLSVRVVRARPTIGFNIMAPGSRDVALYNSSVSGNRYTGRLTQSGAYRIRVYQDRAAGLRSERSLYSIEVAVTGRPGTGAGSGRPPGVGSSRPPAIAGRPGSIVGIAGMPAIRAIDELSERGFRSVDSFSSGDTLYGIYYYRPTRLCVQTAADDRRILDIRKLTSHPRCR